jgi:sec1 family domain-containing protein 1
MINGLISVILTMEIVPIIACQKGGNAEIVSKRLEQKIRNLLSDRTHLYQYQSDSYHKKRPVLIITDRDIDYAVCIQHKWIYKSMVHDLFGMKQNSVVVAELKKEESIDDFDAKKKTYDIDFDDEFWNLNSNLRFEEFAEILTKKLKEYTGSLSDFNKKSGLNLEEDALLGDNAVDNLSKSSDQKLSQNMVDDVMELIEGKKRINMHVNISYAVLHEIKTRKLDEYVAIEECLIENRQLDKDLLLTLVREDKKGTTEDKLRLLLIDYLAKLQFNNNAALNKSEVEELERIILQGRGTYSIPEFETLKFLTSQLDTPKEKKHTRYESKNIIFNSVGISKV